MKSKTLFIVSFFLSVHYSFAQRALSEKTINRYSLPHKKVKYKLSKQPFILNDASIVPTNAVFVSSEYLCGEKCDTSYVFMLFVDHGGVCGRFPGLRDPSLGKVNVPGARGSVPHRVK